MHLERARNPPTIRLLTTDGLTKNYAIWIGKAAFNLKHFQCNSPQVLEVFIIHLYDEPCIYSSVWGVLLYQKENFERSFNTVVERLLKITNSGYIKTENEIQINMKAS